MCVSTYNSKETKRFINNHARKEKIPITVFLTNGFQFKGMVKGFDSYTVIVESDGKQELIFKHAISTIVPAKAVNITTFEDKAEEAPAQEQ